MQAATDDQCRARQRRGRDSRHARAGYGGGKRRRDADRAGDAERARQLQNRAHRRREILVGFGIDDEHLGAVVDEIVDGRLDGLDGVDFGESGHGRLRRLEESRVRPGQAQ